MKLDRRQFFGIALVASNAVKPPTFLDGCGIQTQGRIFRWGVQLNSPHKWGTIEHLECVVVPALQMLYDRMLEQAGNRPIRFLEPEIPKGIDRLRMYSFRGMFAREAWAWDPVDNKMYGRLDAIANIG